MKSKHIRKLLLLVAITILLVGLASAATSNKTSTNKYTKVFKDTTKNIKTTTATTKKVSTKTVTDNKTQINKVKEKTSEKTTQKIEKNKQKNTKTETEQKVSSWEDLQTKIGRISIDTTIKLERDLDVTTETITWSNQYKTLTIDGNGQSINGNQKQVFRIEEGSTLHLKNITITNATTTATATDAYSDAYARGGAIYNNGTLTITDSTFTNNTATANVTGVNAYANAFGGAIFNYGTLKITDSTFTNNQVNATANATGGNAYVTAFGGGIDNRDGTLTIKNSTFTNNQIKTKVNATGGNAHISIIGGAIYNWGNNYYIIDTTFYKNTPANFNINSNNKIELGNGDNYISIGKFSIIADGEEIGNDSTYNSIGDCSIPIESNNVEIIINGTDEKTLNNVYKLRRSNVEVHNYSELVNAIETAKAEKYNSYIINLKEGDYNATQSINWEESATKNLIINGNNISLDGKREHQFILVGSGLNLTLVNVSLTNFMAESGGAIHNIGYLTIINSSFTKNTATNNGGAIYSENILNITGSNFIQNTASGGAAIYFNGNTVNLSGNIFALNTASADRETIKLMGEALNVEDNTYDSTDIAFITLNLSIKDYSEYLLLGKNVALTFTMELKNPKSYDANILEKIDKTIYTNRIENTITKHNNFTLSNLEVGRYEINYRINHYLSNTIKFNVVEFVSEITTSEQVYDYYDGLNNNVTIKLNNEFEEKGIIVISVKDGDEYCDLLSYHNVKDEYNLTTETIADALKKLHSNLDDSYIINVTYTSNNVVPSSTEFTLNIIKQRNTSIIFNIVNNTEGNVQINITVIDAITKTPISNAKIKITGAINKNTASGIITDKTLKSGDYKITVNYEKTQQYLNSTATIKFKVEKLSQKTKTKLTINTAKAIIGETVTIKVTVKDSNNKPVTGGKISLKVNGKLLKDSNNNIICVDVLKGVASINYLVPGSWITKDPKIEAIYTGNDEFTDSTLTRSKVIKVQKGSTTITLTPNIKSTKAGSKVTITVKHIDTNTMKGLTSKVAVKVNGKSFKVKVKNGEGKLTYTIPKGMNAKTVKVTASHSSKYYNKATGKTSFKVTKTTPTIKTTKTTTKSKKTTIKGKILDANNKVLTKNVKVTVKVDGKIVLKNKLVKKGKINLSFKKSLKKGYHEFVITSKATKAFNKSNYNGVLKI